MDALQELAGMKIKSRTTSGGYIEFYCDTIKEGCWLIAILKNTFKQAGLDPIPFARAIEEIPTMAQHYLDAENSLDRNGSYNMIDGKPHGRHIRNTAAAIRGPQPKPESKESLQNALKEVRHLINRHFCESDTIREITSIIDTALEGE